MKILKINDDGVQIISQYDKHVKTKKYEIYFNTKSGFELIRGINGNPDPFELEMPSLLDIGIMGHCKNKCSFCYQGDYEEPHMILEMFKDIVDQVSLSTNQIALGGRGDPNHHPDFKQIIEYCREKNVVPNYTTSGIELTDEQVDISKMCGAVAVSQIFSERKIKVRVRRKKMSIENDFLKEKTITDENGKKWEVCSEEDANDEYEYKEMEIYNLKTNNFTFNAIQKFIDNKVKTNIHFIYSKLTHNLTMDILNGVDIWNGKVDITKLNAVIFLLFKPHGAGEKLDWKPTQYQMKELAMNIFKPQAKFKIGMDSCLVNHMLKYGEPTKIQRASLDTCEAARMSAYITPDMRFMPCSFADEEKWSIPINNNTDDLHKIWDTSDNFNKFRKSLRLNKDCCPLGL